MNFDFSEYHPLDHAIWDTVCWGWAGGVVRHIKLWWAYQFQWPWQPYQARRSCAKGIHHPIAFWKGVPKMVDGKLDMAAGLICRDCSWRKEF